jgi:putative ABC transport system permease protein
MKTRSPKIAQQLLRFVLRKEDRLHRLGDFEEVFQNTAEMYGKFSAWCWYWSQVFRSIPNFFINSFIWSGIMLKNYFKTALRNLRNQKVFSFINITGLAIGLACSILIYIFISYELSFDKYHTKASRIYRVISQSKHPDGIDYNSSTQFPFGRSFRNDYQDLGIVSQLFYFNESQVSVDKTIYKQKNIIFAEPQFLEIFNFNFILGEPNFALSDPNSVILSNKVAKKYFGDKSPLGEVIKLSNKIELIVNGVIEDPPTTSHIPIQIIASLEALTADFVGINFDRWSMSLTNSETYILLPENYPPNQLSDQLNIFKNKYLTEKEAKETNYGLQSILDIHFNTRYSSFNYQTSKQTILLFSVIGILILCIAGINFVNLATGQAVKRSREVGMRKVLGAYKRQLINQFFSETLFFNFFAVLLAILLAQLFLPGLNQFLGNQINLNLFGDGSIILFLAGIFIFISLLTGIYPAFVLTKFNPINAFKNKISTSGRTSFSLRNSLVIFQFLISQILIVCTIVMSRQMDVFYNKELGFNQKEIISIELEDSDSAKLDVLKNKLLQNPNIKNISFALGEPTADGNMITNFKPEGVENQDSYQISFKPIDENYLDLFDIKLLAGRFFRTTVEDDTLYKFIVNETLIAKMGIHDPHDAIGKMIKVSSLRGEIIGVVQNFHTSSLASEIIPLVFTNQFSRFYSMMNIKYVPQTESLTIKHIENEWEKVFPDYVFEYEYYDDFLHGLYETENKLFTIIKGYAMIAILIGCLGIFGLISFIAVQKTKEIGVRKVLGATVSNILILLSKEFTKNILLANLIAWPTAYFILKKWLENFAYKATLSYDIFLFAGFLSLLITLFTISFQAVKTARTNPIKSLKYE